MRVDAQALDVSGAFNNLPLVIAYEAGGPQRLAAERSFEPSDGAHRHRIVHLLMELRVRLRGRETVLAQEMGMIEIDGRIAAAARRIDVDHLDIFADRAGRELGLPRHR